MLKVLITVFCFLGSLYICLTSVWPLELLSMYFSLSLLLLSVHFCFHTTSPVLCLCLCLLSLSLPFFCLQMAGSVAEAHVWLDIPGDPGLTGRRAQPNGQPFWLHLPLLRSAPSPQQVLQWETGQWLPCAPCCLTPCFLFLSLAFLSYSVKHWGLCSLSN